MRLIARAPVALYRARLGWVFGQRFLLLEHLGRKSGALRRTVLEVVKHDVETGRWWVASCWSEKSQWFLNVMQTPDTAIVVGTRRIEVRAKRLSAKAGLRPLLDYAERDPSAFRSLASYVVEGTIDATPDSARLLADVVTILELVPR